MKFITFTILSLIALNLNSQELLKVDSFRTVGDIVIDKVIQDDYDQDGVMEFLVISGYRSTVSWSKFSTENTIQTEVYNQNLDPVDDIIYEDLDQDNNEDLVLVRDQKLTTLNPTTLVVQNSIQINSTGHFEYKDYSFKDSDNDGKPNLYILSYDELLELDPVSLNVINRVEVESSFDKIEVFNLDTSSNKEIILKGDNSQLQILRPTDFTVQKEISSGYVSSVTVRHDDYFKIIYYDNNKPRLQEFDYNHDTTDDLPKFNDEFDNYFFKKIDINSDSIKEIILFEDYGFEKEYIALDPISYEIISRKELPDVERIEKSDLIFNLNGSNRLLKIEDNNRFIMYDLLSGTEVFRAPYFINLTPSLYGSFINSNQQNLFVTSNSGANGRTIQNIFRFDLDSYSSGTIFKDDDDYTEDYIKTAFNKVQFKGTNREYLAINGGRFGSGFMVLDMASKKNFFQESLIKEDFIASDLNFDNYPDILFLNDNKLDIYNIIDGKLKKIRTQSLQYEDIYIVQLDSTESLEVISNNYDFFSIENDTLKSIAPILTHNTKGINSFADNNSNYLYAYNNDTVAIRDMNTNQLLNSFTVDNIENVVHFQTIKNNIIHTYFLVLERSKFSIYTLDGDQIWTSQKEIDQINEVLFHDNNSNNKLNFLLGSRFSIDNYETQNLGNSFLPFHLAEIHPENKSKINNGQSIRLEFTRPVNLDTLNKHITFKNLDNDQTLVFESFKIDSRTFIFKIIDTLTEGSKINLLINSSLKSIFNHALDGNYDLLASTKDYDNIGKIYTVSQESIRGPKITLKSNLDSIFNDQQRLFNIEVSDTNKRSGFIDSLIIGEKIEGSFNFITKDVKPQDNAFNSKTEVFTIPTDYFYTQSDEAELFFIARNNYGIWSDTLYHKVKLLKHNTGSFKKYAFDQLNSFQLTFDKLNPFTEQKWEYELNAGGEFQGDELVGEYHLYAIELNNSNIYLLKINKETGQLLEKVFITDSVDEVIEYVYEKGIIYLRVVPEFNQDPSYILAYDVLNNEILWSTINESLYISGKSMNFSDSLIVMRSSESEYLIAVDKYSGKHQWKYEFNRDDEWLPSVLKDKVYSTSRGNLMINEVASGEKLIDTLITESFSTYGIESPVIDTSNNQLILQSDNGLFSLSLDTYDILWKSEIEETYNTIALYNDTIYAGNKYNFHTYDSKSGNFIKSYDFDHDTDEFYVNEKYIYFNNKYLQIRDIKSFELKSRNKTLPNSFISYIDENIYLKSKNKIIALKTTPSCFDIDEIVTDSFCYGSEYTFYTKTIHEPGFYKDTIIGDYGCLEIKQLELKLQGQYNFVDSSTYLKCFNESIIQNGKSYDSPGTYIDTVLNNKGCYELYYIKVNDYDTIYIADTLIIADDGSGNGKIILDVRVGSGIESIQWGNGETGSLLDNIDAGTYSVTITDKNGCSLIREFTVPSSTSVQSAEKLYKIKCYPNPTTEEITIDAENTLLHKISIYNSYGNLIKTLIIDDTTSASVNLSNYSAGTYFLKINNKIPICIIKI